MQGWRIEAINLAGMTEVEGEVEVEYMSRGDLQVEMLVTNPKRSRGQRNKSTLVTIYLHSHSLSLFFKIML